MAEVTTIERVIRHIVENGEQASGTSHPAPLRPLVVKGFTLDEEFYVGDDEQPRLRCTVEVRDARGEHERFSIEEGFTTILNEAAKPDVLELFIE